MSIDSERERTVSPRRIRSKHRWRLISRLSEGDATVTELANDSIKRINNYSREKTIKETNISINYLNEQISSTSLKESQDFLYNMIDTLYTYRY